MCGFAGISFGAAFEPLEALRARVWRMIETIRHRGPDSGSSYDNPFCAVGFRRLAIIDLATGEQPVSNADGSIHVFFNGEIYNHRELRERLRAEMGLDLRHGSDAIVLPHLYEKHGPDFVNLLNGMFAICVIDERASVVRLYRDRLGIKPLYWAENAGRVAFGSELKPLFASGVVAAEVDVAQIVPFLELFYVPGAETVARGVSKLMPGEELVLERGKRPRLRTWYQLADRRMMRTDATLDEVDALLADAVKIQLVADVPVGISLSGGLDSSLVAHYAKGADVRAYTVAFPETDPTELATAKEVAGTLGHEHVVVTAQAGDFLADLDSTAFFNDEPVADPAFYSALLVARAASRHVKVLLSGTGADELFAGYGHHTISRRARAFQAMVPFVGSRAAAALLRWRAPQELRSAVLQRAKSRLPLHALAMTHLTEADRGALADVTTVDARREMRDAFQRAAWMDGRNQQLFVDTTTYLPHQLLSVLDRTTMAASIEGRVPYLDHRLAELCFAMPGRGKFRGTHGGKWMLRQLASRHLPAAVASRRKLGFPSSVSRWLASERRDEIHDRLLDSRGLCVDALPEAWLRGLLSDAAALQRNAMTVHSLLVLQAWHRAFVRSPVAGGTGPGK